MQKFRTVDEYIIAQKPVFREPLHNLRELILLNIPDNSDEVISYGIPVYKHNGMLVGFGTRKSGISFYVMNTSLLAKLIGKSKQWKGSTLYIDMDVPLPAELIQQIIRYRLKQNLERKKIKGNKKDNV